MTDDDRIKAVAELWAAHREAAFPARLTAVDIAGVEMVMLDAGAAGCISTWLINGGDLDDRWWDVLAAREQDLARVVPHLAGYEASYYQRLLDMTALVLGPPDDFAFWHPSLTAP
ncbi:hypothetical protein [Micromonospora sp. NBC_01796]|uniref:hypothetical protein n=1 Tax=Micromonospora sp. NBC_01796 TaxID=2975987 RepID=UPI002DDA65A1|nr:hypothetical protein [Micromonospora sp. NBC_01796]WSA83928.1 hypothetical protein OIE47_26650 [Micromonospora sp. NBC_01796]